MTDHLQQVLAIAVAAGEAILDVYKGAFEVHTKDDGSPLTEADRRAHALIHERLQQLTPDIPMLSEESDADAFAARRGWRRFWLVDPLDGTKGFVRRNDEFTVNIALIEDDRPVLGVVHAPVTGVSYYAAAQSGSAFKTGPEPQATPARIRVKKFSDEKVVMVASRSHGNAAVDVYRERLAEAIPEVQVTCMGSSLKICLVAEGRADIYPRLGPTSEWDTAAAHCVLEAAGGEVTTLAGAPLKYNKANILNPWFLATANAEFHWPAFAHDLEPPFNPHPHRNPTSHAPPHSD